MLDVSMTTCIPVQRETAIRVFNKDLNLALIDAQISTFVLHIKLILNIIYIDF